MYLLCQKNPYAHTYENDNEDQTEVEPIPEFDAQLQQVIAQAAEEVQVDTTVWGTL